MRAVRTDGELELEEQLVRGLRLRIPGAAILPADLTELARPVRQQQRLAGVAPRRIRAVRPVVAGAGKPAARELVLAGHVEAVAALFAERLLAAAPDDLRAPDERVIDRPLQRPPPHGGIEPGELCDVATGIDSVDDPGIVVTSRIREPEIDVGVLVDVLVSAQMPDVAQVAALARREQVPGIAAEHLTGRFEEEPRVRNQARHREPGIVDPVFAADE